MDLNFPVELIDLLYLMLILMGISLVFAVILLGWVVWRIRRINLPPGADFFMALRATPLSVVILLDLLDFGLDIFAAPFAWTILGYLGLKPLRNVSVIESLIPGTQFVPTMTVAWFIARQVGPEVRLRI